MVRYVVALDVARSYLGDLEAAGVKRAAVRRVERTDQIQAAGVITFDERRTARVGSLVEGVVEELPVQIGDRVAKGALLADLHSHVVHDAWAAYFKAQAERRRLETELAYAETAESRAAQLVVATSETGRHESAGEAYVLSRASHVPLDPRRRAASWRGEPGRLLRRAPVPPPLVGLQRLDGGASSTDGVGDVHLHEAPFAQLGPGAFTEKLVQIFDANGRLVLQSTAFDGLPPVVSPEVVQQALLGSAPIVSATVSDRPLRVAVLTASREERQYAVAVGLFADDVMMGLRHLAWLLATVWIVNLIATGGIGYRLASHVLAPVARIRERAAWIAQGNFDARLDDPVHDDEIGRMIVLLNSMLDRLQGAVEGNRRFAADASHELRGPLTAMAGELDVVLRHPRSAEGYEETLRHVRGQLSALIKLAGDLILLTRAQEGTRTMTLRELDLTAVVEETFRRIAATAQARGITLEHEQLEGIHIYADTSMLPRVLDNVIANAVHYNHEHGRERVTARVVEPTLGTWVSPVVHIEVTDTGGGIPDRERERIFERFFRLDQARSRHTGGSGLGLSICRELLKLHGGSIRVAGSSWSGTTIEIRIPGRGSGGSHALGNRGEQATRAARGTAARHHDQAVGRAGRERVSAADGEELLLWRW